MAEWLQGISLAWGKIMAMIFFGGMIVWAWFRPRSYIFAGAPDQKKWRDLRVWATVLLGVQFVLYIVF
jgi:hypothetical protein